MIAKQIADIIQPRSHHVARPEEEVNSLLTDSRRMVRPEGVLFFAIPTRKDRGDRYVELLYSQGVRNFVVPSDCDFSPSDANVWLVDDVVLALQHLASAHRCKFNIPVVGITGSNGKTIVKDWLAQMIGSTRSVVASPKSYNSQIGVPLSVWQMAAHDELALFEAGISHKGEMERLRDVIRPTIGLLTHIGDAHDEGFESRRQKIEEKLSLFTDCGAILYCADQQEVTDVLQTDSRFAGKRTYTWGHGEECDLRILSSVVNGNITTLTLSCRGASSDPFQLQIPFDHAVASDNALACVLLLLYLGYDREYCVEACRNLTAVETRMELVDGVAGSMLINDAYSLDIGSLDMALNYLTRQQFHHDRTLILSDVMQSGLPEEELYRRVAELVRLREVGHLVGIGEALCRQQSHFAGLDACFYPSTEAFLEQIEPGRFANQTVLLKGARVFGFERIAARLRRHNHETVLQVNLDALVHNMACYRAMLKPNTRLMAMVKAASYGAGTVEVAAALQRAGADYLTVAYADEGVTLRQGGITLPIMVMNPEPASFDDIVHHCLEPDLYSFRIMQLFADHLLLLGERNYPVHIEFDTGMHRLGFRGEDVPQLLARLADLQSIFDVRSSFSHLACSEDPAEDAFTLRQIECLRQWSADLPGMKHILNSSGIARFPQAQMDMVRLGIGLYGIAPEAEVQRQLRPVSRLVSRISQIKEIPAGESVGYNRRFVATRPTRIAILTIGYADGLHRGLGNGRGHVLVDRREAPIIGSVCMDMCFVDVTDIPCSEGDEAILFGEGDLLQRNAAAAGTIPYELLTSVAPRVKRIFFHEG